MNPMPFTIFDSSTDFAQLKHENDLLGLVFLIVLKKRKMLMSLFRRKAPCLLSIRFFVLDAFRSRNCPMESPFLDPTRFELTQQKSLAREIGGLFLVLMI